MGADAFRTTYSPQLPVKADADTIFYVRSVLTALWGVLGISLMTFWLGFRIVHDVSACHLKMLVIEVSVILAHLHGAFLEYSSGLVTFRLYG